MKWREKRTHSDYVNSGTLLWVQTEWCVMRADMSVSNDVQTKVGVPLILYISRAVAVMNLLFSTVIYIVTLVALQSKLDRKRGICVTHLKFIFRYENTTYRKKSLFHEK